MSSLYLNVVLKATASNLFFSRISFWINSAPYEYKNKSANKWYLWEFQYIVGRPDFQNSHRCCLSKTQAFFSYPLRSTCVHNPNVFLLIKELFKWSMTSYVNLHDSFSLKKKLSMMLKSMDFNLSWGGCIKSRKVVSFYAIGVDKSLGSKIQFSKRPLEFYVSTSHKHCFLNILLQSTLEVYPWLLLMFW